MLEAVFEGVAVVERDLFAGGDVAGGDDTDAIADDVGAAIWFAGVVDESGDVGSVAAVDGGFVVENVEVVAGGGAVGGGVGLAGFFALGRFLERDTFAGVFGDKVSCGDRLLGVDPVSVNVGMPGGDGGRGEWSHGGQGRSRDGSVLSNDQ